MPMPIRLRPVVVAGIGIGVGVVHITGAATVLACRAKLCVRAATLGRRAYLLDKRREHLLMSAVLDEMEAILAREEDELERAFPPNPTTTPPQKK